MRYQNTESGVTLELGGLDGDRRAFYRSALEKFEKNVSWFEFETFAFGFTSPVFHRSRNRSEVLSDSLYVALKDMWLQLGINQGFVANPRGRKDDASEKKGPAGPHRAKNVSDVAASDQPRVSSRRGR
jgi:hypothetical protein